LHRRSLLLSRLPVHGDPECPQNLFTSHNFNASEPFTIHDNGDGEVLIELKLVRGLFAQRAADQLLLPEEEEEEEVEVEGGELGDDPD
jgi:hypothetical protein